MKPKKDVKPFAWQTTEPEIPVIPTVATPQEPAAAKQSHAIPAPQTAVQDEPLPDGIKADSTHAYLWHHSAEAAAVLRTMMQKDDAGVTDETLRGMTARQVAAAVMSGLGIAVGTRVMRHLRADTEARWMGLALSEEPQVTHRVAMACYFSTRWGM